MLAGAAWADPTVIAGTATNGTSNKPVAGEVVQLVRPKDDNTKDLITTTRTDAQGHFAFPPRVYGDDDLLMADINHNGFDYWGVAWDGGHKLESVGMNVIPSKVDLLVFDTTTQPVPLDFEVHHLAISSTATGLHVIERIVVENPSKLTFLGIGPRKISILLNLPPTAQNVKIDPKANDATLARTTDGWGIIRPITPDAYGVRNAIIVDYDVDWPSQLPWERTIDFSRYLSYPTKFFFVARETKDKDLKVDAPGLSPDEEQPLPIDGATQIRIVNSVGAPMMPRPALEAGKYEEIRVSKPVNPSFWGFGGIILALCLFIPVAVLRPKSGPGAKNSKSGEPGWPGNVIVATSAYADSDFPLSLPLQGFGTDFALNDNSRALIQQIADLDDLYEAGKIEKDEYQQRRNAWKTKLIESFGSRP